MMMVIASQQSVLRCTEHRLCTALYLQYKFSLCSKWNLIHDTKNNVCIQFAHRASSHVETYSVAQNYSMFNIDPSLNDLSH